MTSALISVLIVAALTSSSFTLTLRLHAGEQLVERRYEVDRVDWKLPHKRMEHFRNSGVVIDEELRTTSTVQATVVSVSAGVAHLSGQVSLTSFDVPRNATTTVRRTFVTKLRSDNAPLVSGLLSLQDAAMTMLPSAPLHLGERWRTHARVTTTLGSGDVVFDHQILSLDNGLVKVAINGSGAITGSEYHLPKLLPGTIALQGDAWYDLDSGLITQESYAEHNSLLKPAEDEQIGFDERLTVDVSTRKR